MNVRGSAAHGPTTATRRSAGRPSPSSGSAVAGVEQDDRALGHLAGERAVGRRSRGRRRRRRRPSPRASSPGRAGRARTFWRSTPPRGPVDERLGAARRGAPARRAPSAEAEGVGQLDVDAGGRAPARRPRRRRRRPGAWSRGTAPPSSRTRRCRSKPHSSRSTLGEQPRVGAGRARRRRRSRSSSPSRRRRARSPSRTAAGSRRSSSRRPIETGPWLRAAREAE